MFYVRVTHKSNKSLCCQHVLYNLLRNH